MAVVEDTGLGAKGSGDMLSARGRVRPPATWSAMEQRPWGRGGQEKQTRQSRVLGHPPRASSPQPIYERILMNSADLGQKPCLTSLPSRGLSLGSGRPERVGALRLQSCRSQPLPAPPGPPTWGLLVALKVRRPHMELVAGVGGRPRPAELRERGFRSRHRYDRVWAGAGRRTRADPRLDAGAHRKDGPLTARVLGQGMAGGPLLMGGGRALSVPRPSHQRGRRERGLSLQTEGIWVPPILQVPTGEVRTGVITGRSGQVCDPHKEVRTGVILTVSHQDRCDHRGGREVGRAWTGAVLPAQSQTRRNIGTATGDTPLISAPLGTHTCDFQAPLHTHL